MSRCSTFPAVEWSRAEPEAVGLSPAKLEAARQWRLTHADGRPHRAVIVRDGCLVAEWYDGMPGDRPLAIASAAKSFFSCLLGVAIAEGKIRSADDFAVDYFPQLMDVPEGAGPKPGRFARDKDRRITLRQLISNTSGYLKPGEEPGRVFNYQTFGMNVLCHAIASAYGVYDPEDPDRLPGFGSLLEKKLRDPIGAHWTWTYTNFNHGPHARINYFGNYTQISATPRDCARVGLLWLNFGWWGDKQVVPESWLRQAVRLPDWDRVPAPGEERNYLRYGLGFWLNVEGRSWPDLPPDSFAASGAGGHAIWVCPSLNLVVVISPGFYRPEWNQDAEFLSLVCEACE